MVALDFPDAPAIGQVFNAWEWDGDKWVRTRGGDIRVGAPPEYIDLVATANDKIRLVEDTPDGTPYVSFWNQDASGELQRKGMIGSPDALSDTSDMVVQSDTGDVRLQSLGGAVYANNNRVLTVADEGSGNGIDADTLDGLDTQGVSVVPGANKIIRSNGSGYIYASYINTTSGATTGTPTKIFIGTTTDDFLRYVTPATFRSTVSAHIVPCDINRAYDASGAASSTVTVTLAATLGGVSLTGATGVFGTVTCVPTQDGYVTIFPQSLGSVPTGSNVNYSATAPAPASGYFFVELDSSRRFKLYRHGATRTILDVQGLVFG